MSLKSGDEYFPMDISLNSRSIADSYIHFLNKLKKYFPNSVTHSNAWKKRDQLTGMLCIRHDVDHNLETAYQMALLEHELDIKSTYYLLPPGDYGSTSNYYGKLVDGKIVHNERLIEISRRIQDLGHEIGLHNDFVQLALKLGSSVDEIIRNELEAFKKNGVKISGTASHGSRFAIDHGYINYQIFSDRIRPCSTKCVNFGGVQIQFPIVSMESLGLEYEAYDIPADVRISDIGGQLTLAQNKKSVKTDFIDNKFTAAEITEGGTCIALIHPDHWVVYNAEFKLDDKMQISDQTSKPSAIANWNLFDMKKPDVFSHLKPRFERSDGKPFRIGIRGDCVCRRAVQLNRELFPNGFDLVVNEKTPNATFRDTVEGRKFDWDLIKSIVDVDSMEGSLSTYFHCQFDRSVLDAEGLDLIIMDSYSDMNFQLWKHRQDGWRLWIHPRFTDMEKLDSYFLSEGYIDLNYAVTDACRIIDAIREKNHQCPVLFMYQPVEFYSKLNERKDFYDLGKVVSTLRPNVYWSDILSYDELGTADVGSCGPEQTLHFDGETYLKMITSAWSKGLSSCFKEKILIESAVTTEFQEEFITPKLANKMPSSEINLEVPPPELLDLDLNSLPVIPISYGEHRKLCLTSCYKSCDTAENSFAQYFIQPASGDTLEQHKRFTPMVIPVNDDFDFNDWELSIKKFGKGARIRKKRKATSKGMYCKPFAWRLHIPDVHEINHSKIERSGGVMRGGYLRSIEELGGAPTQNYQVTMSKCQNHWNLTFGAFIPIKGYKQGDIVTNEKLVAYISLRRIGDIVLYSQIMGHGDHLNDGALILLHHSVVSWLTQKRHGPAQDLRFIMYGGGQNGGQSLYKWKRQSGFKPCHIVAYRSDIAL